jgi:hypothetical protein
MEKLACPWVFTGPSGSGKASLARKWIEEAHGVRIEYPLKTLTFQVGDGYEARVHASPYHFEIDIPNLSMQDKQIIGELLTMFLSSGDVFNSLRIPTRKLVVLRRAHCLSLPAAIRVRGILQQYVLPGNASGMIWMTTREITGPLALLQDAFVRYRVPRMSFEAWNAHDSVPAAYKTEEAWNKLEGRTERAVQMAKYFPEPTQWPRRIQDYYDEMVQCMVQGALQPKDPNMAAVEWIRGRVYDMLSFCQTGPEIVDQCAAAIVRNYEKIPTDVFWLVMSCISESESHTSYRTPLSLEWAVLNMFEAMRKTKSRPVVNGRAVETHAAVGTALSSPEGGGTTEASKRKRAAPRSKSAKEVHVG